MSRTVEAYCEQISAKVSEAQAAVLAVIERSDETDDGKSQAVYAARALRALACIACDASDMLDGVQMSPVVNLPATPVSLTERIGRGGSRKPRNTGA